MKVSAPQSLFELLVDYQQRSIEHDVSGASQRDQEHAWDGVVFRLGEHRLTLKITEVDEILPFTPAAPVPGARDWLLGMANVRGNLVTVVDLGWFLYASRTPITARTRLILTRLQGRFLGLMVDEVFGQRHFDTREVVEEQARGSELEALVTHVFPQGDERWGRFRIDRLMRNPQFLDGSARR